MLLVSFVYQSAHRPGYSTKLPCLKWLTKFLVLHGLESVRSMLALDTSAAFDAVAVWVISAPGQTAILPPPKVTLIFAVLPDCCPGLPFRPLSLRHCFDAVNHNILPQRLKIDFDISGTALGPVSVSDQPHSWSSTFGLPSNIVVPAALQRGGRIM